MLSDRLKAMANAIVLIKMRDIFNFQDYFWEYNIIS